MIINETFNLKCTVLGNFIFLKWFFCIFLHKNSDSNIFDDFQKMSLVVYRIARWGVLHGAVDANIGGEYCLGG